MKYIYSLIKVIVLVVLSYFVQDSFFKILLSKNDFELSLNCTWLIINIILAFWFTLSISFEIFLRTFYDVAFKNKDNIVVSGELRMKKKTNEKDIN